MKGMFDREFLDDELLQSLFGESEYAESIAEDTPDTS